MQLRLGDAFTKVKSGDVSAGWIYFRENANPTLSTECLLVSDDEFDTDFDNIPSKARLAGFMVEGLDIDTIKDCVLWAKHLGQELDPAIELESFVYYWRFDAFLPHPGAPDPPAPEIVTTNADRKFFESLGEENMANPCRNQSCHRGAIQYSVFCRVHHFENIRKRTCPFTD